MDKLPKGFHGVWHHASRADTLGFVGCKVGGLGLFHCVRLVWDLGSWEAGFCGLDKGLGQN